MARSAALGWRAAPTSVLAIARITARDTDLPPARQPGPATDLKVLSDYRDQLLVLRNAEANRLHADLAIICPGYAQICRRLTAERSLTAAGQLLADLPAVRAQVARRRILLRGLATSTTTVRIPVPLAMTLLHRPT
jgi:transposase